MSEQILPFYAVCDESYSMMDEIDALNEGLADLHEAISTDPVVADKTRFCVIGFSDTAEVLLPLCDLGDLDEMAGLTVKGSTNYGAAFDLLRDTIESDIADLKAQGHKVYRPAVFFMSDGQPNAPWEQSFDRVTDPTWPLRPNIVAFGMGDAHEDTVKRVATFKAFLSDGTMDQGAALHEFATALTKSIVRSGSTATEDGGVKLQIPDQVPGFTALKVDQV
ncbi:uncharacterized protein YegL [Stackebrandtia endophytica]|uniref:Uncharacterized protein YegL n=1 Tax=Stackebrandtia endophytica TaxID=1496996 RepID=A0A543APT2_9ACTN|nr:VWA domain-containing protein [Stackebrandtia endophytica]TQL74536.1 uncharacterized protein YegL [Stackebrandtia endophytica]